MVIRVYVSGISGNKEVKKRQQRVLMILDSRNFKYELLDIAEPGNEEHKDFMHSNSTSLGGTVGDPTPRHPLPPQIFNDTAYCGDYDQFDMANEIDELEKFLKVAPDDSAPIVTSSAEIKLGNGNDAVANDTISSTADVEAVQNDVTEKSGNVVDEVENEEIKGENGETKEENGAPEEATKEESPLETEQQDS